ncbi:neogenin-like isoform X1 [Asterias amurensis]|uniref:neogenin-like isoform X1 n=1 Tax=Asterias amurensis TaxID=7602 RepID=UPI003AB71C43
MASFPCNSLLLLTTLIAVLVSCDGRPNAPDFTSYFTSPTNLRVEWTPGTDDGGGTVNGYRLHYRLGSKGKMVKLKIPDSPLIYDITGLQNCGDYFVRMATTTTTGLSRYSSFASAEKVASAPKNLNVVAQSGTSAMVNWTPPSKSACIGGYQLQYGPNENSLNTMTLPADLDQYILGDLQSGTSYLLTLAATSTGEVGEEAYAQWYQAPESSSKVPPIPRRIRSSQSDTEIVVTWEPPSDTSIPIEGYTLTYGEGVASEHQRRFTSTQTEFTITDLIPDTSYVLSLRAFNQAGEGKALVLEASTVPSMPGSVVPPIPLGIQSSQSDTEIVVTWQAPSDASIEGYTLSYGVGAPTEYQERFPSTQTEFTITDLIPDTAYVLSLKAFNQVGEGPALYLEASTVQQTGPPTAPTNIRANPLSPQTAIISWSPTSSGLTRYTYLYGPVGSPDSKLTQGHVEASSMMVDLEGLDPGVEYVIKVSSVNSVGKSHPASLLWSQPGPATQKPPEIPLPAAPGQVSVQSTSPRSAVITWTRPPGSIHIAGYIVGFGLTGASQSELMLRSVASDQLAHEIEGLKVGTKYRATVQAYNNDGDGPVARAEWRQQDVPEQLSLPTQPRGVLAYSSSPSSIDISWMLSEITEPISGFQVSYGTNPEAEEFRVEVERESDSVEIQDLKPDSLYYLKIYAINAAGRSDAVRRSVQTLDLPPEERCKHQQQQCTEQFGTLPSDEEDGNTVCPRILQILNCLQLLRDTCMHEDGYRGKVDTVRGTFLRKSCNRNPRSPAAGEVIPGVAAPTEVIEPPVNLQTTIVDTSTIRLSWTDSSLGHSQVVNDNRFYNIQYGVAGEERKLNERTRDTSYEIDDLLPGVSYEFTVQLILDPQRRSALSEPVVDATRDPAQGGTPNRFTVLQVTVSSPTTAKAVLNWLPPPETGSPKNYIVEYTDAENFRDPSTVWERMTIPGTQLSAVIDDLTSDQEYHARVTAQISSSEMGPLMASPATFTTPVIPPSPNVDKPCDETEEQGVTRRVNFLWDGVVDGAQRPPLYGIPIPYCDDEYSVEECHGLFCFCIPGKKPPALRQPKCSATVPPCRREYTLARQALDEARLNGMPAMSAMLPHCRDDGYYHPKQCSGTICYCVTENGAHTGQERPMWEAARLRC